MKDRLIHLTGSSSGIRRSITEELLATGVTVLGLAREHQKFCPDNNKYKTYTVDLADTNALAKCMKGILISNPKLDGSVINAGFGLFDNLENFSIRQISSYINSNLVSQIVLASYLIPHFKNLQRGDIIFMGSESGLRGAKKGSLYSAAKFGLRGFAQGIREECATKDVRVSIVNPGMVRTPFFETLNFAPGDKSENAIEPSDVAKVVLTILSTRSGTVIDEVNLTPQKKVIKFE